MSGRTIVKVLAWGRADERIFSGWEADEVIEECWRLDIRSTEEAILALAPLIVLQRRGAVFAVQAVGHNAW